MKQVIRNAIASARFVSEDAQHRADVLQALLADIERADTQRRRQDATRLVPHIRLALVRGPVPTKRHLAETIGARLADTAAALEILLSRQSVRRTTAGYELVG